MSDISPKQSTCGYQVAVAAPLVPPASVGGVASAHYNLYLGLTRLGCEATLLTYNEFATISDEPGILHGGAPPWLRSLIGSGVAAWLKLHGSKGITYQLHDIIASIPGVMRMNRQLARLEPEFLIIPDRGAPGLCLRQLKAQVIQVIHHVPMRFVENSLFSEFCKIDAIKATELEQKALKCVDVVVCPSAYIRDVFHKFYHYEGEVVVISNAVDEQALESIAMIDVRQKIGLAAGSPVVYIPSAGSFFKGSKFVPQIIRSLAQQFKAPLGFYLSGKIDDALDQELDRMPDNVRIYKSGLIGYCENIAMLKSCSFGVSPTLIENFSMALLEAGCCGVPMVTFDVGGNKELIVDGKSGFLVPCHDLEKLLQRASNLFLPVLCGRMQEYARNHVKRYFGSAIIAKQYQELFDRYRTTE